MKAPLALWTVVLLLTAVTLPGCGSSCGATLSNGMCVEATSDTVSLTLNNTPGAAIVTAGDTTITVKPTELLVDGASVAKILSTTAKVRIARRQGRVCVVADGNVIFDSLRR